MLTTEELKNITNTNASKFYIVDLPIHLIAQGTIVKYAEEHNVDVIVVGTRGMSGSAKQLLGSVALGVVTYAHCTVIVVK
jgi:nucleotide-binding universal stress UspA family protein